MLVPKGLHVLVRLRALGIEGAAYFSFVVLVKGEDEMKFVLFVLIPQFQGVVITAGDVPVQSAEDTFVIVDERLASELSKEAVSEVELCPGLVQDETAVLVDLRVLSPDAYVLCGKADREVLPLVIHGEAGTVIDEAGRLLPFATGI